MTDYIPGVWYEPDVHGPTQGSVYAPRFKGDSMPWVTGGDDEIYRHNWYEGEKLRQVYNPHDPPTFRNQNFCPSCAKAMPDVPGQKLASPPEDIPF